jgi:hypothetical protein
VKDARTGDPACAHSVDKFNAAMAIQSTAETCAKHFKETTSKWELEDPGRLPRTRILVIQLKAHSFITKLPIRRMYEFGIPDKN